MDVMVIIIHHNNKIVKIIMCWLCLIGHQSGGQQTQSNQRKVSDQGDVWRGMENKEGFSRQMRGRVLLEEETACKGGRTAAIVALQHLCCCRWHLKWDDGWEMVWGEAMKGLGRRLVGSPTSAPAWLTMATSAWEGFAPERQVPMTRWEVPPPNKGSGSLCCSCAPFGVFSGLF